MLLRHTRSRARRVKDGRASSASGGSSPHGSCPRSSRTTARSPCSSSYSEEADRWFVPQPGERLGSGPRNLFGSGGGAEPTRNTPLRARRDRRRRVVATRPAAFGRRMLLDHLHAPSEMCSSIHHDFFPVVPVYPRSTHRDAPSGGTLLFGAAPPSTTTTTTTSSGGGGSAARSSWSSAA
jgi:hypothetical protein